MANQSKIILAKLLANENISVQYGNYQTAFFDVQNRVLGLPLWKQMGKGLTDLLIGHEVGHALYTPADGWHDSTTEIPGCPRSYINVVEDIRIEKKIQSKYPGLVRSFKLGYKDLFDRNFFGTKDRELSTYSLVDRINVKAKLRDMVEVEFSSEEQPLVDMVFNVETWEDVINACRALHEYIKEQEKKNGSNSKDNQENQHDDFSDEISDSFMGSSKSSEETGEQDETSENLESGKKDKEVENSSTEDSKGGGDVGSNKSPDTVETDQEFRSKENELLEKDELDRQPLYARYITRKQYNEMLFTYEEVKASREERKSIHPYVIEEDYKSFLDETKRTTGLMAKEFEMRKAAYRTIRAQTARTGSIDVSKLYSYKYNDDIFAKVTNLADAKSHGMIMLIDYSGSMDNILGPTIKQTLNLATFCKKVGIPYEIYGFTSGDSCGRNYSNLANGEIDHQDCRIFSLLNSSMNKTTYEEAFKMLYISSISNSNYFGSLSRIESFGGTPLNEVVMASNYIISSFLKKFPVQKVNLVLLTDGDGRPVRVHSTVFRKYSKNMIIEKNGKFLKTHRRSSKCTALLLDDIKSNGVTTIGYRLAERAYDFKGAIWGVSENFVSDVEMKAVRKIFNKQKFVSIDGVGGYDRYFIVKADKNSLDTDIEEFDIDENASKAQIAKAFKKHTNSKKGNRVLATKFAEIVA